MTLTHTKKTVKPGMTLLELTVVILVLLSLISILFVGARAWKKGSDRAANIMNLRNVQQAVRSEANMKDLEVTEGLLSTVIIGPGLYLESEPSAPVDLTYTYDTVVPAVGVLYTTVGTGGIATVADYAPKADSFKDW
jgi:prepilin-type N-terminal cleavage/methylation domain-containing protein